MAGIDASELMVGLTGHIYTAPVGTAYPADAATAPTTPWVDLGFASVDGVRLTQTHTIKDIEVWQSLYPARRLKTKETFDVKFALVQWNTTNLKLAFGGGAVATYGTGVKYTPPVAGTIDDRAYMFEVNDGANVMRIVLDRGTATIDSDVVFKKDEEAALSLNVAAIALAGSSTPWAFHFINAKMVVG